jgi:hypothetical protein
MPASSMKATRGGGMTGTYKEELMITWNNGCVPFAR